MINLFLVCEERLKELLRILVVTCFLDIYGHVDPEGFIPFPRGEGVFLFVPDESGSTVSALPQYILSIFLCPVLGE